MRTRASLSGIFSVVAIGALLPATAIGDTVVTKEVTTTTRYGTVTEIAPSSRTIVVDSKSSPEPTRYYFTDQTAFVGPTGTAVSEEVVRDQPVTLYFDNQGGRQVVSKVVMAKPENVAERPETGIRIQSDRGIPYVSGGTGREERDALESMAQGHDLKLIFATQEGEAPHSPLVSDVSVRIRDQAGREVLGVSDAGPWFFAQVPRGTYQIEATARGRTLTQTARVEEGRRTQLAFYW